MLWLTSNWDMLNFEIWVRESEQLFGNIRS